VNPEESTFMARRKKWHELEELGQRIREARERLGITQGNLAALMGRTQDTISSYELGNRAIRVTELPALAKALKVPIGYFFGYESLDDEAKDLLLELQTMSDTQQKIVIARWRHELEWWKSHETE
jgi:transcriptional regulator with XRE-family HTH domain